MNQEFKNCNFQYLFLNWNILVNSRRKFIRFGRLVVEGH